MSGESNEFQNARILLEKGITEFDKKDYKEVKKIYIYLKITYIMLSHYSVFGCINCRM